MLIYAMIITIIMLIVINNYSINNNSAVTMIEIGKQETIRNQNKLCI